MSSYRRLVGYFGGCCRPGWRAPPTRMWVMLVIAVAGSLAFVNVLRIVTTKEFARSVQDEDRQLFPGGASNAAPVQRLPASIVRIEPPKSSASGSGDARVKLVLSIDSADIADLVEAYRRGFAPVTERFPDDGGFLMHNKDLCRQPLRGRFVSLPISWIVFVHSSPSNTERRQILRDTWANVGLFKNIEFRVVFLIGRVANPDSELQKELQAEFDKYGDLVQGNFIDSYKNMTLKAVMGLHWLAKYCPEAPYALKADDDTFLNIFELVPVLKANENKPHVIICPLWPDNSMPILRDPKTCMKWCVGRRELRGRTHFPQYCAGIGYVVSRGLVPMLYNASLSTPFFWIDDVYVTGLLAKKLPVAPTFVDVLEHFSAHDDVAVQQYNDRAKRVTYWYVHAKDENNYWTLWRALMKRLNETQRTMINADVLERWAPSD